MVWDAMLTAGIDLAADPKRTGVCEIDWATPMPAVTIGAGVFGDQELAELVVRAERTGIDSPFGWPDRFVAAIQAYHEDGRWSAGSERGPLKLRETDLYVHAQTGRQPLSVSTDRIGVTAMRCAHVLQLVQERGGTVDRSGMTGSVTEVYPAAALRRWQLDPVGYKAPKATEKRRDLLSSLERALQWPEQLPADVRAACIATDHVLDALLSALVARAAARGLTAGPPDSAGLAAREGWIHLPTCGLADLREGAARSASDGTRTRDLRRDRPAL
jgi:hypothetical protein